MTGDLGWVDDAGYLRITGRLKEVIIRGGRNIYPARIEALATTHDAVGKAAAFAVIDPRLGERVCLAVVARKDMRAEPEAILRHLRMAGLSEHDMPEFILPLDEMPLTASGKVIKLELARWVEDGRARPLSVRSGFLAPVHAGGPSVGGWCGARDRGRRIRLSRAAACRRGTAATSRRRRGAGESACRTGELCRPAGGRRHLPVPAATPLHPGQRASWRGDGAGAGCDRTVCRRSGAGDGRAGRLRRGCRGARRPMLPSAVAHVLPRGSVGEPGV